MHVLSTNRNMNMAVLLEVMTSEGEEGKYLHVLNYANARFWT
jgi:hypothetical protein